jgi:ferric iron reductase protein FhuF
LHQLKELYIGSLAELAPPRIERIPGHNTLPARQLLDTAYLGDLLDRFGAQYGHGDRRAVASLWSKWHFSILAIHALAASLLLDRDLPLGLDDLHLQHSSEGHTSGLVLPHAGRSLAGVDPCLRFATLLDGHLAPLVEALAATTGASPRVFWSNAGNYIEYVAGVLADHPMAPPGVTEPVRTLLERCTLPDGLRNPLYRPVRYIESIEPNRPHRVRRLCCIRYLIEGLGYCSNCPIPWSSR